MKAQAGLSSESLLRVLRSDRDAELETSVISIITGIISGPGNADPAGGLTRGPPRAPRRRDHDLSPSRAFRSTARHFPLHCQATCTLMLGWAASEPGPSQAAAQPRPGRLARPPGGPA